MANLSSKTGFSPLQTQISLTNNATTSVQDMSAYDAQEVTGFVYVDASSDLRCSFTVMVVKNGAGTWEVASVDLAGDNLSGAPFVTFSMSGSILRVTLANIPAVFASAYIRYQLSAPYLGGNYPLSVSASQVLGNAAGVAPSAGYIGEYKEALGVGGSSLTTNVYNVTGNSGVILQPGVWEIQCLGTISPAATTTLTAIFCFPSTSNINDSAGVDYDRNAFTSYHGGITTGGDSWRVNTPIWRVNVTSTTTYYPKLFIVFNTSTCTGKANIFARRIA